MATENGMVPCELFIRIFSVHSSKREFLSKYQIHRLMCTDLAAMAYIYKRIKETDPVREASHVVIDEAQDFGMMVYRCLHYCMRGCTYTVMGDTSQNIHFGQGLNDWEELRRLSCGEHTMHSDCFGKAIETR